MISSPPFHSLRPVIATALAVLALSLTGLFLMSGDANAQFATEEETQAARDKWQERYRWLLRDQARLKQNVANLEHDYIMSQRRNYPRGPNRERLVVEKQAQQRELAQVEAEISVIYTEARAAGIPPGWLAEVEDEDLTLPAAPAEDPAGPRQRDVEQHGRAGLVDADDLQFWRDNAMDGLAFLEWQQNLGQSWQDLSPTANLSVIPEPSTALLTLASLGLGLGLRRRRPYL